MFRLLLLALAPLCCGVVLAAPATPSSRTCRVLFLAAPDNAPKTAVLSDGAGFHKIELPRMNFSDVYSLPAGKLTLRLLSEEPAEGKPLPPDAPKAVLAEGIGDFYLLLTHDTASKNAPIRMQVVDASRSKFRNGQMLWYNLTPYRVGGQLGEKSLDMKPSSRLIVDAPIKTSDFYMARIGYVPGAGKPSELICSTMWQHDADARNVVFVLMLPGGNAPRIQGFIDSRTKEPVP